MREIVLMQIGSVILTGLSILILLGLNLTEYIEWTWWLVAIPLILPITFIMLILFFCVIVALIVEYKRML
jgi:hypothetical protein